MLVKGKMSVEVEIEAMEAIDVIGDFLGVSDFDCLVVLEKDNENNKTGKKGLFKVRDTSYHGSWSGEYTLITNDTKKIAVYEAFMLLDETVSENRNNKKKMFR